jgi:hypothetical protein
MRREKLICPVREGETAGGKKTGGIFTWPPLTGDFTQADPSGYSSG